MDITNAALFTLAAIMLLGSPGPAIAALIAIGKERGFWGSMRFFWGLQLGLASGAAISAAGLFSVVLTVPYATQVMMGVATAYLIWLAYKIASSPVGNSIDSAQGGAISSAWGGFILGATNPKAYLAFISLIASYAIMPATPQMDVAIKWLTLVLVMIVVDLIWLWLGTVIGAANLSPSAERVLNVVMGGTILMTALVAWF